MRNQPSRFNDKKCFQEVKQKNTLFLDFRFIGRGENRSTRIETSRKKERGKPEYPDTNLSEKGEEKTGVPGYKPLGKRGGENQSPRRKTCRSKGENQQQTQLTSGVWTRATSTSFPGSLSHPSLSHSVRTGRREPWERGTWSRSLYALVFNTQTLLSLPMRGVASGKDDSEKDEKLGRAKKPSKKKTELWTKRN